jgi:addiction module RelE/StbE family toxin
MRTVKHTSRFRRDYKREKSGRHGKRLDAELLETVAMLAKDKPLSRRYFDHALGGEWSDHRDIPLQVRQVHEMFLGLSSPQGSMGQSIRGRLNGWAARVCCPV